MIIVGLIIGGLIATELYSKVLYPAYLSVITVCNVGGEEELGEAGYVILGKVETTPTNVTLTLYSEESFVLKHELCHIKQWQQNRLYSCDNRLFMYFNEIECYIIQTTPDFLFDFLGYNIPITRIQK